MTDLPAEVRQQVEDAIGAITRVERLHGGSINRAARLVTGQGDAFLKWNEPSPMFAHEAEGLNLLREAETDLRIPQVLLVGERFLLLEYIETGRQTPAAAEHLGRGLAQLHTATAERYGLDSDNTIGRLPQPNGWSDSWVAFYRDKRLAPQMQQLERVGRLPAQRRDRLQRLMDRLDEWLAAESITPAPLHGDLWGGNWLADSNGQAVLIDPAAYYGHSEVDIAMSRLFGGFPPAFYDAYTAHCPLQPGHEDRLKIYQLYYLLVHVVLFGESYGSQTDACLRQLVG